MCASGICLNVFFWKQESLNSQLKGRQGELSSGTPQDPENAAALKLRHLWSKHNNNANKAQKKKNNTSIAQ